MGFFSNLAGTALTAAVIAGGYQYLKTHRVADLPDLSHLRVSDIVKPQGSRSGVMEHFSPAENLEQLELAQLREAAQRARKSKRPLDIAMYAFTDRVVSGLLIQEADQGTEVRIYRDGEQNENEERNAARFHDQSTTAMFRGHRNIHIRVKPPSRTDLMHLKNWSDGETLREGSANWSPAALKRQDNDLRFTRGPEEIRAFEKTFEGMWNRARNTEIQ
jgi:phosphatidylserine/phosphatidylglycerophosphate/cardiolipin synthase-like enzyme